MVELAGLPAFYLPKQLRRMRVFSEKKKLDESQLSMVRRVRVKIISSLTNSNPNKSEFSSLCACVHEYMCVCLVQLYKLKRQAAFFV